MGVQGLWTLLGPAGKKIKIDQLKNKRLAIDVSIWVLRILHSQINLSLSAQQFAYVHLIGIFKRICKLLALGIKPVFVFDGQPPELKKNTLKQRNLIREQGMKNLKMIAQKYILKQMDQKNQKKQQIVKDDDDDSEEIIYEYESEEDQDFLARLVQEKELIEFEYNLIKQDQVQQAIFNGLGLTDFDFNQYDIRMQRTILNEIKEQKRQLQSLQMIQIENNNELSKFHVNQYVEIVKQKCLIRQLEQEHYQKLQEQKQIQFLEKHGYIQGNKNLGQYFSSQNFNRSLTTGNFASDHNRQFLLIKNVKQIDQSKKSQNDLQQNIQQKKRKRNLYQKKQEYSNYLQDLGRQRKQLEQSKQQSSIQDQSLIFQYFNPNILNSQINQNNEDDIDEFFQILIKKEQQKVFNFDNNLDCIDNRSYQDNYQMDDIIQQKIHNEQYKKNDIQNLTQNINIDSDYDSDDDSDDDEALFKKHHEQQDIQNNQIVFNNLINHIQQQQNQNIGEKEIFKNNMNLQQQQMQIMNQQQQNDTQNFQQKFQNKEQIIYQFNDHEINYLNIFQNQQKIIQNQIEEKFNQNLIQNQQNEKQENFQLNKEVKNIILKYSDEQNPNSNSKSKLCNEEIRNEQKNEEFEQILQNNYQIENPSLLDCQDHQNLIQLTNEDKNVKKIETDNFNKFSLNTNLFDQKEVLQLQLFNQQMKQNMIISETMNQKQQISANNIDINQYQLSTKDQMKILQLNRTDQSLIESFSDQTQLLSDQFDETTNDLQNENLNFDNLVEQACREIQLNKIDQNDSILSQNSQINTYLTQKDAHLQTYSFYHELRKQDFRKKIQQYSHESSTQQDQNEQKVIVKLKQETKIQDQKSNNQGIQKQQDVKIHRDLFQFNLLKDTQKNEYSNLEEIGITDIVNHQDDDNKTEYLSDLNEEPSIENFQESEEFNSYYLQDQYQKFVNKNNLDGESIRDKFEQVKEMLLMFGIPWVESPGEAEAQCAYLEQNDLVDGIITEDCDVFLFGGKRIFRNFFDNPAQVQFYDQQNIKSELGLSREKLIFLSLFLGSDYTLGIKGVGIVNAMEIVNTFDSLDGLQRFKDWARAPDEFIENSNQLYEHISLKELAYKQSHKNYKKQWELPANFPDPLVLDGYIKPNVDESRQRFKWQKPNIEQLRKLCIKQFKWDDQRANDYLNPLQQLQFDQVSSQTKITEFFQQGEKFAIINSKRLNNAVMGIKNIYPLDNTIVQNLQNNYQTKPKKQKNQQIEYINSEDHQFNETYKYQKKR